MRPVTRTFDLKHKVLNDYSFVVACITKEYSGTESAEVKAALLRVENLIHACASSLRQHS
jgi:hypothetical protein